MTMHKALHSRDDIDWLYVSKKRVSNEDSLDVITQRLYKKEQRKTNYNDQKQHKQQKHQQNKKR